MRNSVILILLLSTLAATVAQAGPRERSQHYYGVGLAGHDIFEANSLTGIDFKYGFEFFKYLAAEAHIGLAVDDIENIDDDEVEYASVFARFNLPFEKTTLYALAGQTRATVDLSFGNINLGNSGISAGSGEYTETLGVLGIGVDLYGSEKTSLTIEFLQYEDDLNQVVTVGFKRHFQFARVR